MKTARYFIVLLLLSVVFSSCNAVGEESFDAFSGAFICEYSYVEEDKLYRVRLMAEKDSADKERGLELSFIEPETLFGIECRRIDGEYQAEYGNVIISGDSAKAFFVSAEPLLQSGKAEFCGVSEIDGVNAELFKISHEKGVTSVYVDGSSELPIAVVSNLNGSEIKLNIVSFERIEK